MCKMQGSLHFANCDTFKAMLMEVTGLDVTWVETEMFSFSINFAIPYTIQYLRFIRKNYMPYLI